MPLADLLQATTTKSQNINIISIKLYGKYIKKMNSNI